MTRPADVEILMAAYQGGPYVADQLDSIVRQTHSEWLLQVSDDRSADDTFAVAERYAATDPRRIFVRQRETNTGSAQRHFLEMLTAATGRYIMLADDDDVWLPDKVDLTLREMRRLEDQVGADVPLLVHTDLTVVDATLRVMAPSMAHRQRLAVHETRLARLLVQNPVTGCTVMVNRALAELVQQPFDDVAMHDWWLALLAAAFGRIGYIAAPTVLYRQHASNTVGAVDARSPAYLVARATAGEATRARMRVASRQAAAFLDLYGARLTAEQRATVAACAGLAHGGKVARIWDVARFGLWKNTLPRRLGQLWFV